MNKVSAADAREIGRLINGFWHNVFVHFNDVSLSDEVIEDIAYVAEKAVEERLTAYFSDEPTQETI